MSKIDSEENNTFNIQDTIDKCVKRFGKGSIMQLDSYETFFDGTIVSSGSLGIDIASGIGGFPLGRIIEIYGAESSGKTTLALHTIAQAQKLNLPCAFIDSEHALDLKYAQNLGVQKKSLLLSQPDYGEQALEILHCLINSEVKVIVIDSVASLVPKAEVDGSIGDSHMGLQARLMSQALRKLTPDIKKNNVLVIFINQTRSKIGIVYGSNETTSGGVALKFYASMRINIKKIKSLISGDSTPYGSRIKVKFIKNKVAPPLTEVEFDLIYGKGIDYLGEVIDVSIEKKFIAKAGSWYKYNDTQLGQGKINVVKYLEDHGDIKQLLEEKILSEQYYYINAKDKKLEKK